MTTGEKIRRLRKKQNMSQEQLGNILGLSRQAVSRWETENAVPETAVILKLSEVFCVTTDYLLKESADEIIEYGEKEKETKVKYNVNLAVGICAAAIAFITFFIVLVISAVNPEIKDGTAGIMDLNFWKWNGFIPFAVIIAVSLCIGVYYIGRFYFRDWQPK
jgi:transcriptional regulator with XRE-family HTH domain